VLAYAHTQKAWALLFIGANVDGVAASERALGLVDQLSDERDSRYIRLKAGCHAAIGRQLVGDLIKSRALAKDLMDFASASGSRRALSVAHYAIGVMHASTGDRDRAGAELTLARDAAPDPVYTMLAEINLGAYLVSAGDYEAAKGVIEPCLRFAEKQGMSLAALLVRGNQALLLLAQGELTRGIDQLETVEKGAGAHRSHHLETQMKLVTATVYSRIATGEGMSSSGTIGTIRTIVRNPGFALGRARKASQTARDALAKLSDNLPSDLEGFRFQIEFEFAKLLIKRKERDEARKHLEKAVAFLQPLGDSVGMRRARALLARTSRRSRRHNVLDARPPESRLFGSVRHRVRGRRGSFSWPGRPLRASSIRWS